MHEFLDRMDRRPVHHLHAAGDDARADDLAHAFAGIFGRGKADQHGARAFRLLQDAHRNLGNDAQQALRAGNNAEEIVAAGIKMLAPDADDLAGHQHQLATEQVVGGHAVFEAVHAAGIFRHVAADGAGDLRRGIGRVVEAGLLDRLGHRQVGHARLDHGHAVCEVDLANAIELGHAEKDAVLERQGTTRERGAGPARHHLDAFGVAERKHAAHLLRRLGQHHHHGELAIRSQAVGFVWPHLPLGGDHPLARHDGTQPRHDAAAAGKHGLIRRRHCDCHLGAPSMGRPGRIRYAEFIAATRHDRTHSAKYAWLRCGETNCALGRLTCKPFDAIRTRGSL